MDAYFLQRKTCRTFSDKDISNNKIKEILEAAMRAPTTGNMQLYSVIITRDKTNKNKLAEAHFSQSAFVNAPVILTFCADFNRFNLWCKESEAVPGFDNLQSLVTASIDAIILAQQFVTIAEMEGIGTCYLGTTTYNPDKIAEILKLPKRVVPITSLAIGYPSGQQEETDRLDVDAVLHTEHYKDYTGEEIRKIYENKEKREDSKAYIAQNNKSSLAQVFTDVRYPKENNELFSRKLRNFLKDNYPGL